MPAGGQRTGTETEAGFFFTALQILTDLNAQAPSLVSLPSKLGNGVALDENGAAECNRCAVREPRKHAEQK